MAHKTPPVPPPKTKNIYGVPVLPVMVPLEQPEPEEEQHIENSMEDTVSTGSASSAPPAAAAETVKYTLKHIDFMPNPLPGKKEDDYEKFPSLVERANQWLAKNRCAASFSCETMTWMAIDKPVYSDNGVIQKSMTSDKKTRILRGLRIWYFVLDDTFYSGNAMPPQSAIRVRNYMPELSKKGEGDNVLNLVKKLNTDMSKKQFPGKILKVETLHVLQGEDADCSFWKEQPDKDKHYVTFLRVFLQESKEQTVKYGDLGIQDFIPKCDQRTVHNSGYEVFSDLWKRASRWIFQNSAYNIVGFQSVYFKYKKEGQDASVYDRCFYKEHGSAHGTLSSSKTEFLQILRVVYAQPTTKEQLAGITAKKVFHRSFAPSRLKKPSGIADEKEELSESTYEDLRMTEERINSWLAFSGAKVIGVETVPVRLRSGGQENLGAESTFVWNSRDKNTNRELWRYTVRLHIDGEFKEVPVTWTRHVVENATITKTQ